MGTRSCARCGTAAGCAIRSRAGDVPTCAELGGQGLWITNQVCDLVQLRSFSDGSAVRIHMRTR